MVKDILDRNYKEDETHIFFAVGLLHDILEDTKCTIEEVSYVFDSYNCIFWGKSPAVAIQLLTHNKEEKSYQEYMENILSSQNEIAFIVKRADLKDHFLQKETLTPELVDKYLPYVGDFL